MGFLLLSFIDIHKKKYLGIVFWLEDKLLCPMEDKVRCPLIRMVPGGLQAGIQ